MEPLSAVMVRLVGVLVDLNHPVTISTGIHPDLGANACSSW